MKVNASQSAEEFYGPLDCSTLSSISEFFVFRFLDNNFKELEMDIRGRVTTAVGGAILVTAGVIDAFVIGVLFEALSIAAFRQSMTLNNLANRFWSVSPYHYLKITVWLILR